MLQEDVRLDTGVWRSSQDLTSLMIRENHQRTLRCLAHHGETNTNLVTSVVLNVTFPPYIISVTHDTENRKQNYYLSGDTAVLLCDVESNPAASIRWRHLETGRFTEALDRGRAVIQVESSSSTYECVAENEAGVSVSGPLTLPLAHGPRVLSDSGDSSLRLNLGDNLTLLCEASGIPEPEYRWLFRNPSGDISVVGEKTVLNIDNVGYQHAGGFLCEASNVIGTSLGDVYNVSVEGKPAITNSPNANNFTVMIGDEFSFLIEVCSHPEPNLTWFKGSKKLNQQSMEMLREGCYLSKLLLPSITQSEAGVYRVTVSNQLGSDSASLELHVATRGLSRDLILGAGAGATIILLLILAPAVVIGIHRRRKNNAKTTTQLSGSNTKNYSDIENPSQHGSKEELIVASGLISGAAEHRIIGRNLYSQLGIPKSSNCGSMRRKKENQSVDNKIKVFNAGIAENLSKCPINKDLSLYN